MARKRTVSAHPPTGRHEDENLHTPLDRNRIVQTALQLLNESGLKELSMRKIADKLQVKTASLYYHVEDKDQLMRLLLDQICGTMAWPDSSLPWNKQLIMWAEQFKHVLLSHRDAVELFNSGFGGGYERLTQMEKLYGLFVTAGFKDDQIPWIASMVKNYVLGFAAEEARIHAFAGGVQTTPKELGEQYSCFFRQLPEERFPHLIRLASHTTNTNWAKEFEFGLGVLINGFAAKLQDNA
ncbi:TetR/AcrR family transcriptional regulator [Paenibacillus sp. UNC499MF]|uniref:TetR/AcrR family transcriptional regulator n=1 Tax=Paenibacillus sp. UNC499MF TaxID=1502751 RepID=UPI00089F96AA|nr:TetR/AcrR family transcriptional regulator [Paenibacillus sp. UNC499MF]SEG74913.1 transcriptional regulator, TetR family [Paenibacillus sp. UNC499MF]